MWTILKFDKKKLHLFKSEMGSKIDKNFEIYNPKLLIQKFRNNKLINKEHSLLGDYIFCYHKIFSTEKGVDRIKFFRGVKYLLSGSITDQSEISKFIETCKQAENSNGFITQNTFSSKINRYYKFRSGPFTDKIFKIIELQKNKMNILMGNIKTTINKKDFLFDLI